jgi:hypothetical protein
MKSIMLLSLAVFLGLGLGASSAHSRQSSPVIAGQAAAEVLIEISAPTYRWLKITNEPPVEGVASGRNYKFPGMAMCREEIHVSYNKGSYRQDIVRLVIEVDVTKENGGAFKHQVSVEKQIKTSAGTLWSTWAAPGMSVKGRSTMRLYLTENKKNGKIVSNIISLPVAAGPEAERQLESELGPWLRKEERKL